MHLNKTIAMRIMAAVAAIGISAIAGAQGAMGMGAGPAAMRDGGQSGGAPTAMEFIGLWQKARAELALSKDQTARLSERLVESAARLSKNYDALAALHGQEGSALGDALATLRKRIEIALSERDLIVSETETELKDFMMAEQTEVVMAAAFHGVSASHSDQMYANGMGEGMGGMATMAGAGETEMGLAERAGKLNKDMMAASLDTIIKDLSGR